MKSDSKAYQVDVESALLENYECDHQVCPICTNHEQVLFIFVRGLCDKSQFDRIYMYNIGIGGELIYHGIGTSMIKFEKSHKKWLWYDMDNNGTFASSPSPYNSLLIGTHFIDFSSLSEDKCKTNDRYRKVKFTTCSSGFFTCDQGNCIPISQHCDQAQDCNDLSDEQNCELAYIDEQYKKNIAPFTYKDNTKR